MRARAWQVVLGLMAGAACFGSSPDSFRTKDGKAPAERELAAPDKVPTGLMATRAEEAASAPATPPEGVSDFRQAPDASSAMIIRTGNASLEIAKLDPAVEQVRALARRVGGFVANTEIRSGADQVRSATLEIKVPAQRFDELVAGLEPIGTLEYVNISAQDVGEEFTDVTARVANSRRLEQRLIDLLATRTGKLSDVLAIERELARVREEIERMEGRLRYLRAHVATSTLNITVHEKAPIVGDTGGSLGVIGRAFGQAWRNFVEFVAGGIEALGWLLPLIALGVGLVWTVRRWRRGRPDLSAPGPQD